MKNKIVFFRMIILMLTIIWMCAIFFFSSRPADVSTEDSHAIGMAIGAFIVPEFENLSAEEQLAFAEKVDYPVRKTAHATEYAILGLLMIFTCMT
ncbi:MAG: VanZ family protein [Lachnospiraceae bacterium]|nr:VanZ family protein [Lachnospiraceae bacterium]